MRLRYLAFVIGVIACGSDPEGGGDTEDTGTESTTSTTMTASSTMPGTSGADTSSAGPPGSSSGPGDTTASVDTSTTAAGECSFAATVEMLIEDSAVDPVDCGQVTLADDDAAWQAARDCAREATLDQLPYRVLWQHDDGGTLRDGAFASEVGETYAIYRVDDDAAEGTTSITFTSCTGISTPNDCMPTAGQICIECLRPGEPTELCE